MLFGHVATPDLRPVHSPSVCLIEYVFMRANDTLYGDQVVSIPKIAAHDTTLTVSTVDGGKTTFPVPSGTEVVVDISGLHYNRT